MDIKEAYKTLGVAESISDEDLKRHYKEMAKTYHPDVYKSDPNKFTQINEAYQLVTDYRANPHKYQPKVSQQNFWGNMADLGDIFFGGFGRPDVDVPQPQPIKIQLTISFHESVLGCQRDINYDRHVKCNACHGAGFHKLKNDCDKCDGFGRVTTTNRGMVFQSACTKCRGAGVKQNKCDKCNGQKTTKEHRSGNIGIPAGSNNQDILRLPGAGHFAGRNVFGDAHTDVLVELTVQPYKQFNLKHYDVHTELTIPLLDALTGSELDTETVYGDKHITVPAKSKHLDQIKIPKCGVQGTNGCHIVTLHVEYPTNLDPLIGALQNAHAH